MKYKCKLFLIPVIASLVAFLQMYLASYHRLSPWMGGGFGMFSTIDHPNRRFIKCFLITEKETIPVTISLTTIKPVQTVFAFPSDKKMNRFAVKLSQYKWTLHNKIPRIKESYEEPSPNDIKNILAIKLELWRVAFDNSGKIFREKIKEVEIKNQ